MEVKKSKDAAETSLQQQHLRTTKEFKEKVIFKPNYYYDCLINNIVQISSLEHEIRELQLNHQYEIGMYAILSRRKKWDFDCYGILRGTI